MNDTDRPDRVDVGGYHLWLQLAGEGAVTVVFENGGGDDASVWSSVEPEVRHRCRVRTVLYDRAGLGRSEPKPGPYRIDDEANALRSALTARKIEGPVVLVAHSYGSFVSLLTSALDPRITGLVLVEGNIPSFFDADEVGRLLARFRGVVPMMTEKAPRIAQVMVPLMEALPKTAQRLRAIPIPTELPIVDITAERTWVDIPEEIDAMRSAHAAFVAASSARRAVFVNGCGHYVMRERPEVVVDAVASVVPRARTQRRAAPSLP